VVIFDLDRTITRAGTYTPFLLFCAPRRPRTLLGVVLGAGAMVAYVLKFIGRGTLKAWMLRQFIAGSSRVQVAAWSARFVGAWMKSRVRPGALEAIERHRAAGDRMVLVTASFDFYAQVFADRLGLHGTIATASVWDDQGRLVAALGGENCYGAAKLAAVKRVFPTIEPRPRVVAYSDHHTDFELLCWADEGVAVNPSARLHQLAAAKGMRVVNWN
jgi:HAD superfamily hydrolase (TIGR01490 family)